MIYRLISLFADVGGIDRAFENAEFKTIYANELDPRDIREVKKEELPEKVTLEYKVCEWMT